MIVLEILFGFLCGYILASLIESYMHQYVSDAPNKTVKKWQKFPRLCRYLIRTRYSHHVVHHRKTFRKDHVTQFTSQKEQDELDAVLKEKGKHGEIILDSQYAVKLHGSGSLVFISPLIPAGIVMFSFFGLWAALGSIFALMLPPLFSNFVHPYLHMPYERAVQEVPSYLSWFVKTRYYKAMVINHFMHHRYVAGNYNLVLGGDILRGVNRKPTEKDIEIMQGLGLIDDSPAMQSA